MTDPVYSGDFFVEQCDPIKEELVTMDTNSCMTASVPIPPRKLMDFYEMRDFGFEFVDIPSPSTSNDTCTDSAMPLQCSSALFQALQGPTTLWGSRLNQECESKTDTFRMDEDDIFQVDKADLIQGPTLAELNANDENLLEDLSFDDLLLPDENSYYISVPSPVASQLRYTSGTAPPLVHITNTNTNINNNNSALDSDIFAPSSFPPFTLGYCKDMFGASSSVPSSPIDQFVCGGKVISTATAGALSPVSRHSSSSSLLLHSAGSSVTPPPSTVSPLQQKHSTLHELLLKKETFSGSPERQLLGQSVPGRVGVATTLDVTSSGGRLVKGGNVSSSALSRLSSSAPTHLGLEQIWQRREPRQHLLSTSSMAEAGSTSSLSTGGVLSPESHEFSHDEGFDSEEDSDHYEDFSSDAAVSQASTCPSSLDSSDGEGGAPGRPSSSASKRERYFWQYNVQAKGPKGQRLVLKTQLEDPHVLNEVTDPVFSPECSVRGIKHRARCRAYSCVAASVGMLTVSREAQAASPDKALDVCGSYTVEGF
uniref:Uncharacterized protein n=1 Tax=Timema monikensis TaxID=170555 RepID=A0A7R9HPH0_9NEOP|nr:unnamed protein product [Timema monikensis]